MTHAFLSLGSKMQTPLKKLNKKKVSKVLEFFQSVTNVFVSI